MTKKEIVKQIADEIGLTQAQTREIVQRAFDLIIQTLVESPDHRIELRNFGVFEVKLRQGRRARNPKTREPVEVPPKLVVTFKPGKRTEELIARLDISEFLGMRASKSQESEEQVPAGVGAAEAVPTEAVLSSS
ncbi:MAG: HU family DNA-binding protein [Gemmatales bacterium]|nr:integration host factor subunit beta [Gemmatales bacterium]MDW7993471.1 HU family DNA-binding protein [Gemmatales bacterium]